MPDPIKVLPPPQPDGRPALGLEQAGALARQLFGKDGRVRGLPSYSDQNFRIGSDWVLKVSHQSGALGALEAQHAAMAHLSRELPDLAFPMPAPSLTGPPLLRLPNEQGGGHWVRLCRWVPGDPLTSRPAPSLGELGETGALFGRVTAGLASFGHAGARRELVWDLLGARDIVSTRLHHVADEVAQSRVRENLTRFQARDLPLLGELPRSVVHNDLNTDNLVTTSASDSLVTGILDFGDLVESVRVADLVIGATYLMLGRPDPLTALERIVMGYEAVLPLDDLERELLVPLIRMRLSVSIVMAAETEIRRGTTDEYLTSSQQHVRDLLSALSDLDDLRVNRRLRAGSGHGTAGAGSIDRGEPLARTEILASRRRTLGPSLSLSYEDPLHIVRGRGAHLFDAGGEAYLDCVNNIAHVGHEHPVVVDALRTQAARLNTNTRYLHELRPRYAERLLGLFPDRFEVCYLVCSGSEANELALRLARTASGGRNMVVLQGGYHGNTSNLVELSSYKYDGAGGQGRPDWVQEAPTPDPYRGIEAEASRPGSAYAARVAKAADRAHASPGGLAGFLAEPILGCAGQIVPPDGFLSTAMSEIQGRGGLAIADEVQVGFGRVGETWWGFELDGALPDIVTLGKPMGNGHPLGAVVTTRPVADAFHNGMEYFNSFGGNPVSCAVGLAVLDVLEAEGLRENARTVGNRLLEGFARLMARHECIGDVRGRGLYLGIELVKDREARSPDAQAARALVEQLRTRDRILLSVDGPQHNVIKIKPPLVFSAEDADRLLAALGTALDVVG